MTTVQKPIDIDFSLTPDNAQEWGFEWFKDLLYNPDVDVENPELFAELHQGIAQGWKLGQPALEEMNQNGGVGLYKPLEKDHELGGQ